MLERATQGLFSGGLAQSLYGRVLLFARGIYPPNAGFIACHLSVHCLDEVRFERRETYHVTYPDGGGLHRPARAFRHWLWAIYAGAVICRVMQYLYL
ncbi:hypothetical protein OO012_13470 [Rhodobacteraceae bacterium KMM 6894]|nr:hypothetical protein [Rhodobacteraceae bacterium KMM 6894]